MSAQLTEGASRNQDHATQAPLSFDELMTSRPSLRDGREQSLTALLRRNRNRAAPHRSPPAQPGEMSAQLTEGASRDQDQATHAPSVACGDISPVAPRRERAESHGSPPAQPGKGKASPLSPGAAGGRARLFLRDHSAVNSAAVTAPRRSLARTPASPASQTRRGTCSRSCAPRSCCRPPGRRSSCRG
jgi:hypothetical protein